MQTEKHERKVDGSKLKIAIILPYFNEKLGQELLKNVEQELLKNNVDQANICIVRVAGALEIPFACQKIIKKQQPDGIIALGIIIKGKTDHYHLVINHSHQGLMKVQLENNVPIVFGILACENIKQALERVSKNHLNKGKEFAQAMLIQATL